LAFKKSTPEGYSYDESVDRCRGPGGQFTEEENCTEVQTYAWLSGSVLYDVYVPQNSGWRGYVGAGGDVGAFVDVHGVAGLTNNLILIELRAGANQVSLTGGLTF